MNAIRIPPKVDFRTRVSTPDSDSGFGLGVPVPVWVPTACSGPQLPTICSEFWIRFGARDLEQGHQIRNPRCELRKPQSHPAFGTRSRTSASQPGNQHPWHEFGSRKRTSGRVTQTLCLPTLCAAFGTRCTNNETCSTHTDQHVARRVATYGPGAPTNEGPSAGFRRWVRMYRPALGTCVPT